MPAAERCRRRLSPGIAALSLAALLACAPPAPLPKNSPKTPSPVAKTASTPGDSQPTAPPSATPWDETTPIVGDEVEVLATKITASHRDQRGKAEAIYEWVAKNITYDIAAFLSGDLPNPAPLHVLATKSGVCEGYARLYVALAEAAGLEAVMVTGFSKGFSPDDGGRKAEPDHAWCAVKFDGGWHLLDPTWGAGHIDETKKFVPSYSLNWFDTPPEQFVTSHLPEDSQWQQLASPWSAEKFWTHPTVSQLYFHYGLKPQDQDDDTISMDGTSDLYLSSGRDCRLMAALYADSQKVEGSYTLVERQGRDFHVAVSTPKAGRYRLVIFAGEPESNRAESALVYNLDSGSGGPPFPQTLKTFTDEEVQLVAPRAALSRGRDTELVLLAPGATAMMAVVGQEQIPFQKSGERFTLELEPKGDKVTVFGNYDGGDQYSGLVEFPVR